MAQKGFIFDLDGTLADTKQITVTALNHILESHNLKPITIASFGPHFGKPLHQILQNLHIAPQIIEVVMKDLRNQLEIDLKYKVKLFPGVLDVLEKLSNRNISIGIATNKPRNLTEIVIQHTDLRFFNFHVVCAGSLPPKPEPAIIIETLKEMNTNMGIMIGDQIEDSISAFRAGIPSALVHSNSKITKNLNNFAPDFIFNNFKDLDESLDLLIYS